MTDGTSQGLFVIVAVVIFGIFVGISYLLFKDILKTKLTSIFTDSLTQAEKALDGKVDTDEKEDVEEEELNDESEAIVVEFRDIEYMFIEDSEGLVTFYHDVKKISNVFEDNSKYLVKIPEDIEYNDIAIARKHPYNIYDRDSGNILFNYSVSNDKRHIFIQTFSGYLDYLEHSFVTPRLRWFKYK